MRKHLIRKIVISVCLLGTIVFIFHNSLEPAGVSSQRSGGMLVALQTILGKVNLDFLTEHMLRKMAHFSEFALEGALLILFFHEVTPIPRHDICVATLIALFGGLITAMTDETIQLFVEGRSSQVTDVWIDFCGVLAGVICMRLLFLLRRQRNKGEV